MNKEKQREEAVRRMQMMGLMSNVIKDFKQGRLNFSEGVGFLYWIDESTENELLKRVRDFEKEHDAVVYHVIHNRTNFGELYSFLYVSQYDEEWEYDDEDIKAGYAVAYVENINYPDCSEFGSISFQPANGGLMRVG